MVIARDVDLGAELALGGSTNLCIRGSLTDFKRLCYGTGRCGGNILSPILLTILSEQSSLKLLGLQSLGRKSVIRGDNRENENEPAYASTQAASTVSEGLAVEHVRAVEHYQGRRWEKAFRALSHSKNEPVAERTC